MGSFPSFFQRKKIFRLTAFSAERYNEIESIELFVISFLDRSNK
ncbi:hypothetical protein B4109_1667 [Geobacillus stearothermophilus]|uniref:Uncharacterized protein n=1 Tax=Geobacillus stearothermophilus TaxID=1422 RepID=A0A150MVJ5_GEOSE|nr:hypothetical protein B4109_1667 [Geobacillus stearothermophilus]